MALWAEMAAKPPCLRVHANGFIGGLAEVAGRGLLVQNRNRTVVS
jgi:hypothetical protein